jgi:type VI secretion system protein ImpE
MNAAELYRAGQLQKAMDAQIQEVKSKPADQAARVFLFELACFAGDLDRAQRQIDAIKYNEVERDAGVQSYRKLLDAERLRRRLFTEGLAPKFLTDPPDGLQRRLEAINCLRGQQTAEAAELLRRADEATPPVLGQLNDKPFDLLRDCDDIFGPVLEVMARGDYFWIGLEQLDKVVVRPPQFPRDLLWLPARVEVRNGPAGDVFLPVLYPGSHEQADDAIKLGRLTDWTNPDKGPVRGVGLRTFLLGDEAITLPEWRELQITSN